MKPFLIVTLRRTGGTSFTHLLAGHVGRPKNLREPFNRGKAWEDLSRDFKDHQNQGRVEQQLRERLTESVDIKHCIDNAPLGLTKALIKVAKEKGYVFVFLIRRDEVSRIRSLFLAKAAGFWGTRSRLEKEEVIMPKKIGFWARMKAKKQMVRDQQIMDQTLSFLNDLEVPFTRAVYEEIYHDGEDRLGPAAAVIRDLGYEVDEDVIRQSVEVRSEIQGLTAEIWPTIKGSATFDAALEKLHQKRRSF